VGETEATAVEHDRKKTEAALDGPHLFVETEENLDVPQFFIEPEGALDVPQFYIVPDVSDPQNK